MYIQNDTLRLYYEIRGNKNKKPLLLIPGAVVDAAFFERAADILAGFYTVITYDRRGNSRSFIHACPADCSLKAQAGDVRLLLDTLGIQETAVIGVSAGGIIGLEAFKAMPERIARLVLYESPLISLIKDTQEVSGWLAMMEDLISRHKFNRCMMEFLLSLGETDMRHPQKPEAVEKRELKNMRHFLEHEFSAFMHYCPDIGFFSQNCHKLFSAVGERSGRTMYATAMEQFAWLAHTSLYHFPGAHNMPWDLPEDFACFILGILRRCGYDS